MTIHMIYRVLIIAALIMCGSYAIAGPYVKIDDIDARSHYPMVRIYVTVYGLDETEAKSLDDTHVRVIEDGTLIEKGVTITRQDDSENYLCVVFSIDSSKSISREFMSRIKTTAQGMVRDLGDRDRIALFRFNDRVVMMDDFTRNKDEIIRKINRIERHGSKTLLYDSIYDSIVQFDSIKQTNRKIIVFTDGKDEGSGFTADEIIQYAKKAEIPVYFISFKEADDLQTMARIARLTGGRVIIGKADDMAGMYGTLLSIMRNRYQVSYRTDLKGGEKSRTVEVRMNHGAIRDADKATIKIENGMGPWDFFTTRNICIGVLIFLVGALFGLIIFFMNREKKLLREQFEIEKKIMRDMLNRIEESRRTTTEERTPEIPGDESLFCYTSAMLIQKDGTHRGQKYHLREKETCIGSDRVNGIALKDGAVSSRHAKIAMRRGVYFLFDLISEGGTYLNGKKMLRPKALHDWDEIRIGRTHLLFRGFSDRV